MWATGRWLLESDLIQSPLVSVLHQDESVSLAVAGLIRAAGFRVWVFRSAEEFLGSGQMAQTACLVVDALLPGMSELQLQSQLASASRHIPTVSIVALANATARADALIAKCIQRWRKQNREKALLEEIRRSLKPRENS